jgi:YVTN family beta-propeller protein
MNGGIASAAGKSATVAVGASPRNVAISPDSTRAYVANAGSNSVSVINTATNTVVTTLGVGSNPVKIAITPNGARAYVTNNGAKSVSVINTATNTVVATVGVGTNPVDVSITPDGTRAYVTNAGSNSTSVIDTSTNAVTATVPVGATSGQRNHLLANSDLSFPPSYRRGQLVVEYATVGFRSQEDFGPTLPRPLRCLGTARSSFICDRHKTDRAYFAAGDTGVGFTPYSLDQR